MMPQRKPEPSGISKDDFTCSGKIIQEEEQNLLHELTTAVPPIKERILKHSIEEQGDTKTSDGKPAEPEADQRVGEPEAKKGLREPEPKNGVREPEAEKGFKESEAKIYGIEPEAKTGVRQCLQSYKLIVVVVVVVIVIVTVVAIVIKNSVQLMHKGSWKEWEEWTHCSAKCGGGLQHRERACDVLICGPGQPLEYQVCNRIPCLGNWNEWSEWTFCSATCGGGLQNRTRTCSGGICGIGQPIDYQMCNTKPCAGNWNEWSGWTFCSATCGGGLKYRTRTCNGGICGIGQPIDYQMCNTNPCAGNYTAFSVKRPKKITEGNFTYLTFEENIYHKGNGFNFSTGKFICAIPGIYLFSITLVKKESYNSIICHLWKTTHLYQKQDQLISLILNPSNDSVNAAISSTVVIELNNNDSVYISHCTGAEQSIEKWSVFTGVLLSPFN